MYRLVSNASEGSGADSQAAVRKVADHRREQPNELVTFCGRPFLPVLPERPSGHFERAYLSKIQLADAEHFTYLGDTIEGEHARVRTTVTAKNGSVIAVDYRTRVGEGGSWRVYDLDAEGISLVGNYRTQFNSIIVRSSYSELVKRLKAARESHSGG
jgi:hypothetical protein